MSCWRYRGLVRVLQCREVHPKCGVHTQTVKQKAAQVTDVPWHTWDSVPSQSTPTTAPHISVSSSVEWRCSHLLRGGNGVSRWGNIANVFTYARRPCECPLYSRVYGGIGGSVSSYNASGLKLMDKCMRACTCVHMPRWVLAPRMAHSPGQAILRWLQWHPFVYRSRRGLCERQCGDHVLLITGCFSHTWECSRTRPFPFPHVGHTAQEGEALYYLRISYCLNWLPRGFAQLPLCDFL